MMSYIFSPHVATFLDKYLTIPFGLILNPIVVSTLIGIAAWYIKTKNEVFRTRLNVLMRLIEVNHYYRHYICDISSLKLLMDNVNQIRSNFNLNSELVSKMNDFVKCHSPTIGVSDHEKYKLLLVLELEMAKQCNWNEVFNKYQTTHDIEKLETYVPTGLVEYNVNMAHMQSIIIYWFCKQLNCTPAMVEVELARLRRGNFERQTS